MAGLFDELSNVLVKKKKKDAAAGVKREGDRREKVKSLGKRMAEPKSIFGKTQKAISEREKKMKKLGI